MKAPNFPYHPAHLPREQHRHYISASEQDIQEMLNTLGVKSLEDLFAHIPKEVLMDNCPDFLSELSYEEIKDEVWAISQKNEKKISFLGDGLSEFSAHELVGEICSIRGLTTAYTPYQPERSQGTLMTLWIYQSLLSMITGMEAINASMYERSTCTFEAIHVALRLKKKTDTALVLGSLYPGDLEVLETLSKGTGLKIEVVPVDEKSGLTCTDLIKTKIEALGDRLACLVFPQVNSFGNLEDVHALTNLCQDSQIKSIAVIEPLLQVTSGLVPANKFGKSGADMIVGEGQNLALGRANFGGPGLGIFGIRYTSENKNDIRSTAGRYVGDAVDLDGKRCKVMVLSTREQHIRKEKATSNICSNQSFVASLAGAIMLARGDKGHQTMVEKARENAVSAATQLLSLEGLELAFGDTPFFNEFTLKVPGKARDWIEKASAAGIELGVSVGDRLTNQREDLLKLSFSDLQSEQDIKELLNFFSSELEPGSEVLLPELTCNYLREEPVGLPGFDPQEVKNYYNRLGEQNISPDQGPYPLGSCTMKYNPYINDFCAGFEGFTNSHPQALEENSQGSLEILYHIQEGFSKMLGLSGTTTQPVAGAQGELVGIKMFQAYHRDHSEVERDVLIIPRSAHGTNYATATVAGFTPKNAKGEKAGLILVDADDSGRVDMEQLKKVVSEYSNRIAGIMITNPNTSGIMENEFKTIADMIHEVGGLVYMDGANLNAIAGWVNLGKMGVDAVHSNLHKTFSIPHGGGGPGDAIVSVSDKLVDYLPGHQIQQDENGKFSMFKPKRSIGSFHRHHGNFAHKVRCYTYLRALGPEGVRRMCAVAVLSARYLFEKLKDTYPSLPSASTEPKMHEFILTLSPSTFEKAVSAGVKPALVVARVGKLFLDFGLHAPTVAWPETYGLMIEPTESYTKAELDRFLNVVKEIHTLLNEHPEVLNTVPHFTPVRRIDEVAANKNLKLSESLRDLEDILPNEVSPLELNELPVDQISKKILEAHSQRSEKSLAEMTAN